MAVAEEEVDEVEAEVRMEVGAREDGAEEAVTVVVEVTTLNQTLIYDSIQYNISRQLPGKWRSQRQLR